MSIPAASRPSAFALGQRLYNTISYAGAALTMLLVADWSKRGVMLVALLWIAHFVRRTFESSFVHRYGGRLILPSEYLVEYIYYWGFSTWVALGIASPDWQPPTATQFQVGLVVFVAGELGNTWAHWKLRGLRSIAGNREKVVPRGGPFDLISCPHYAFELMTWLGFAILSATLGAVVFLLLGAAILVSYAHNRHREYQKIFDGLEGRPRYPVDRKAIIPFVF